MPELILGPMLRYVGDHDATVWVETDGPCEVEVLGTRERTFHVEGHHYALVLIEGLEPDTSTPYTVRLDGEHVWPPADGRPPCRIVTRGGERRARLVFGSCRVGAPQREPWTLPAREHREGFGIDALWAFSQAPPGGLRGLAGLRAAAGRPGVRRRGPARHEGVHARARGARPGRPGPRRGAPPGRSRTSRSTRGCYRESWSEPDIRWLLSTVPSTMIFDDHDVHDDWNISAAWRERHARAAVVGRADLRRLHGVLDLPAHRQPLAEPLRRRAHAGGGRRATRTPARGCAGSPCAADEDGTSSRFAFHRDFGRTRGWW